jgi:site-specific DNA recombinase
MQPPRVAIYARVSDPNAPEGTIASQVAALEARLAQDGVRLEPECRFVDDGYTGATLVRPALERLRDAAAAAVLDRLYVHCPDRLARHYAYQVLLIDEFRRARVEVVFLNRAIGTSPEDDLLLQVQGMVAEYERAKIRERSRRGKRHAAAHGVINVLSGAPYGYLYVDRHAGGGAARYEVREEEAAVVRQIFRWIAPQHRRGLPPLAAAWPAHPDRQYPMGSKDRLGHPAQPVLHRQRRLWQDPGCHDADAAAADPGRC